MKEDLLHFVWQHQYFDKAGLVTTTGESINIINPGFAHRDAGPDFVQAKILIGDIEWHGHVELHVTSSDWQKHGHNSDPAYQNVVLHVVWDDDIPLHYDDKVAIPTLELKHRIKPDLTRSSAALVKNDSKIACADSIHQVDVLTVTSMVERALMSRLELKSSELGLVLKTNNGDWEQAAYQWLMKHMGFKKNSEPMYRLAQQLPLTIIRKHHHDIHQLEALLFGVAGMLSEEVQDDYYKDLKREYDFLSHKYGLKDKEISTVEWKYLRLRPANFPSLRIAQVAQIFHSHPSFFSILTETIDVKKIRELFRVSQSDYWCSHYQFGKSTKHAIPGLGKSSIDGLLINVCATLLVSYGKFTDNQSYIERALDLLAQIKPEKNAIINQWSALGSTIASAADSQGLLGLYKLYCRPRQCLRCSIGAAILNR